jgi:hypothetical protein
MPLGDFVAPGTLPRPLFIGRAARLLFSVGALFYLVWLIIQRDELVESNGLHLGLWAGVALAFYYLPDLVVIGFSLPWGRWHQAGGLLIALTVLWGGFVAFGNVWAPPLGWGVLIFTAFYYGLIGVAFLPSAVLAVPG